uniref:Uncharacterized protein n=1 Tax=Salix viminalis TaxID=40686 RepID=A0A6N2K701_SALVM
MREREERNRCGGQRRRRRRRRRRRENEKQKGGGGGEEDEEEDCGGRLEEEEEEDCDGPHYLKSHFYTIQRPISIISSLKMPPTLGLALRASPTVKTQELRKNNELGLALKNPLLPPEKALIFHHFVFMLEAQVIILDHPRVYALCLDYNFLYLLRDVNVYGSAFHVLSSVK